MLASESGRQAEEQARQSEEQRSQGVILEQFLDILTQKEYVQKYPLPQATTPSLPFLPRNEQYLNISIPRDQLFAADCSDGYTHWMLRTSDNS